MIATEPVAAAATLDPDAGRIAGFVATSNGRPGRARILLDGQVVHEVIAVSPISALSAHTLATIGFPAAMYSKSFIGDAM